MPGRRSRRLRLCRLVAAGSGVFCRIPPGSYGTGDGVFGCAWRASTATLRSHADSAAEACIKCDQGKLSPPTAPRSAPARSGTSLTRTCSPRAHLQPCLRAAPSPCPRALERDQRARRSQLRAYRARRTLPERSGQRGGGCDRAYRVVPSTARPCATRAPSYQPAAAGAHDNVRRATIVCRTACEAPRGTCNEADAASSRCVDCPMARTTRPMRAARACRAPSTPSAPRAAPRACKSASRAPRASTTRRRGARSAPLPQPSPSLLTSSPDLEP